MFSGLNLSKKNISRFLIGMVTFLNLQCAVSFLINPAGFAPEFELSGIPGKNVISSLGILFIMWNIPYLFALLDPVKNRVSLLQTVLMQAVGFLGESILWINTDPVHWVMRASIFRFMVFDGGGLLLLLAAFFIASAPPTGRRAADV